MSEPKPKSVYILSTALAVSIGVNAALVAAGVPEVLASPLTKHANVHVELGPQAASTFEGFLETQLCPRVVAAFGVGFICTTEIFHRHGVNVLWAESEEGGTWVPQSHVIAAGYWSAGEPE